MRDWLDHVYPGDTIAGRTTSEANKELLRVSTVCCFEKLISFSLPSVGVVPVDGAHVGDVGTFIVVLWCRVCVFVMIIMWSVVFCVRFAAKLCSVCCAQ